MPLACKNTSSIDVSLQAGQTARPDVRLAVGATSHRTIEVNTLKLPFIKYDNANILRTCQPGSWVETPLNPRNIIGLAELNSSVSNAAEEQVVERQRISGSADQDVSLLNSLAAPSLGLRNTCLMAPGTIPIDYECVYVSLAGATSRNLKIRGLMPLTAQYGFSSGNVIKSVTKSGTNQIHGDAWGVLPEQRVLTPDTISIIRTSLAFLSNWGPIQSAALMIKINCTFSPTSKVCVQATPATFSSTMPYGAAKATGHS